MTGKLARARKAVAGAVGVIAVAVASGQLHGDALTVAQAILIVATYAGIYRVKNRPADAKP